MLVLAIIAAFFVGFMCSRLLSSNEINMLSQQNQHLSKKLFEREKQLRDKEWRK